jgi:hypothetical protein
MDDLAEQTSNNYERRSKTFSTKTRNASVQCDSRSKTAVRKEPSKAQSVEKAHFNSTSHYFTTSFSKAVCATLD